MKVTVTGNASQELEFLIKQVAKIEQPLKQAAVFMERETKLNFVKEQDPDGNPWAKLKASTLRRKSTSAILRETGALAGSVVGEVQGNKAIISVGISYGIFHQTGTRNAPQRKIIGISKERHVPRIAKIFRDHFSK